MKAETRVLRSALMLHRLRQKALEKPHSAKGMLGPSLGESPDTPSLGRRVALGRGLIVDDAGKLRCPAGTPNANQFTDLQMSNCMIPSAETAVNEAVDAIGNAISSVAKIDTAGIKQREFTPSRDAQRIRRKNADILSSIKAQGGHLDGLTPEYIEAQGQGLHSLGTGLMSKKQHTENRKKAVRANIDLVKQAVLLKSDNKPFTLEETQEIIKNRKPGSFMMSGSTVGGFTGSPEEFDAFIKDLQLKVFGGELAEGMPTNGLSEKTLQFIREASIDDIELELENAVRSFHEGIDERVHVQIPRERLGSLISDGRYKTTHEARSNHSGSDVRTDYEIIVGLPRETTPDVRPASGYIVHKDWQAIVDKRRASKVSGRTLPDGAVENVGVDISPYGQVGIYGNTTIRLKPEVADRTRYGWDDSFNNMIDPAPMSLDADIDEVSNALLSRRFKNGGRDENISGAMSFLDAHLNKDFGMLRSRRDPSNESLVTRSGFNDDSYAEALIFGSFELADIDEIEMDYNQMPWLPESIFARHSYDIATDESAAEFGKGMQALFDQTLNEDALKNAGASAEEIAEVQRLIDKYMTRIASENHISTPTIMDFDSTASKIHEYLAVLSQMELKNKLEPNGTKIKLTSPNGLSRFDLNHYSDADKKIGDIAEIWRQRVAKQAVEDARKKISYRTMPATGGSVV